MWENRRHHVRNESVNGYYRFRRQMEPNLFCFQSHGERGPGAIDRRNSMIIVAQSLYRRNPKLRAR